MFSGVHGQQQAIFNAQAVPLVPSQLGMTIIRTTLVSFGSVTRS